MLGIVIERECHARDLDLVAGAAAPPARGAPMVRGLGLAGDGIYGGLRCMSDLETPEADMMRDHSSLEAAPATLRLEESQPDLDPNNPGVAPNTALLSGSRGRETDLRGHGAAGT